MTKYSHDRTYCIWHTYLQALFSLSPKLTAVKSMSFPVFFVFMCNIFSLSVIYSAEPDLRSNLDVLWRLWAQWIAAFQWSIFGLKKAKAVSFWDAPHLCLVKLWSMIITTLVSMTPVKRWDDQDEICLGFSSSCFSTHLIYNLGLLFSIDKILPLTS